MSHRLQVLLDEEEMEEIRRLARRQGLTVAAWVREALRARRRESSSSDALAKLKAVRQAAEYSFPTGDISEMLADIERGYGR